MKISILCATAPKPNPGMLSVDCGFFAFAKRHGIETNCTYYQIVRSHELHSQKPNYLIEEIKKREHSPIIYHDLLDNLQNIYSSDAIVYWGDFSHIASFPEIIAKRLVKTGRFTNQNEALNAAYKYLFLDGAPSDIKSKAIIFGESLLFNNLTSNNDSRYTSSIKSLLKNARLVLFRDPVSAQSIAHYTNNYNENYRGVDCSQLFHKSDIPIIGYNDEQYNLAKGKIGVFFGRTDSPLKPLARFAKKISETTMKDAVWIPWWYSKASARDLRKIRRGFRKLQLPDLKTAPHLGDLLSILSGCSIVVTDTYHVAVNSWKLGVPAICIAEASQLKSSNTSSGNQLCQKDKRQIFYFMNGLSDFYMLYDDINKKEFSKNKIQHIIDLIDQPEVMSEINDRILISTQTAEQQLLKACMQKQKNKHPANKPSHQ